MSKRTTFLFPDDFGLSPQVLEQLRAMASVASRSIEQLDLALFAQFQLQILELVAPQQRVMQEMSRSLAPQLLTLGQQLASVQQSIAQAVQTSSFQQQLADLHQTLDPQLFAVTIQSIVLAPAPSKRAVGRVLKDATPSIAKATDEQLERWAAEGVALEAVTADAPGGASIVTDDAAFQRLFIELWARVAPLVVGLSTRRKASLAVLLGYVILTRDWSAAVMTLAGAGLAGSAFPISPTSDGDPTIGERLRHARKDAGLTQGTLAAKSEVAVSTISNIERGMTRWPTAPVCSKLCAALSISVEWLLNGVDKK